MRRSGEIPVLAVALASRQASDAASNAQAELTSLPELISTFL